MFYCWEWIKMMIWAYAGTHGLAIVSKDTDFRDISLANGAPPKTIWLRVGNCSTRVIVSLFQSRFGDICSFLNNPASQLLELP
jgi:predicted nuclease of predicted toxin-antitoxin system